MAAALDGVADDRAVGERAPGVRARVVQRLDRLADPNEHECLRAGLGPGRLTLR